MKLEAHGVWPFESRHLGHLLPAVREEGFDGLQERLRSFDAKSADLVEALECTAIAALLAAALGRATPDIQSHMMTLLGPGDWIPDEDASPRETLAWTDAIERARECLSALVEDSILKEAWRQLDEVEPGVLHEWTAAMEDLMERLRRP